MRSFFVVLKRELTSYFTHPTAYAVIVVFLLLSTVMAFTFGEFLESREAELSNCLFFDHPLILMLLVPAVGMKLWSEEQRTNTIELLSTMPLRPAAAILGKYAAGCIVWALALGLSFPMVITVDYLGDPDFYVIGSAYLASFLVAASFLALTMFVSAFTRDQVVTLISSVAVCTGMVMVGYEPAVRVLYKGLPEATADRILNLSIFPYYSEITRGLVRAPSLLYFFAVIFVALWGTSLILRAKRA